uniref:hypothetical protein n=1 Tax=Anaerobiospirillum succiniciproducens TaxID=13335 RepID=UPI0029435B4E
MKQTNNAIKFLMAQYRAIFKNANIAMVAAMVASALAAGQAQALDLTGTTAQNPSGAATITGSDTITGASGGYINGLVISGSANSLTATNLTKHIFVGGNVTVSNGASLTLSGAAGSVAGLTGSFDESFDDKNTVLDVNGANLSVTQSQVQMNRINFTDATVTLGTNNEDVTNSDWKDNALINAEVAWKDGKVVEGTGVITVDGATGDNAKTIKLNSGSALVAATFNLNGGKIAMDGTLDAGSGSIIRAYREGDQSVVNFKGTDLSTKGSGNYIAGRTINVTAGTIDVANDSELHLSGTLDGSATEPSIAAAQQAGTVNVTGGKLNVVGNLVVEGKTGNAGTKLNISETAELTGTGSISLGQQARLVINKSSLDKFVKVDGKGGKVNFNGTTSQVKLESSDVADLSKYTYGSGDGADFDVTSQNTIGKIIGDKLAITKGVTGTFTEATGKIKVEAETLSLGAADSESKLSAIQGTTFTQLTAHDKLTLAGKGDKFTIDQGDMFLTNTSATEVSVIDGANINFETGRIQIKGSWTTDSD